MRTITVSASSSCVDMITTTVSASSSCEVTQYDTYHTSPVLPNYNSHGGVCSKDNHLDDDYALGRLCNI